MKLRLRYVMRKELIHKGNVNKVFVVDEEGRRKLRSGEVRSLVYQLRNGKHFDSIFVCNYLTKEKVRRIADGNHRFEAIKEQIAYDPKFQIEVWFAEYKDLSPAEERQVFNLWNIGSKQSADDFLKIWLDEIPYGRTMLDKIPCSIYGSKTRIKMKHIVGNHIMAKKQAEFMGGYSSGGEKTVADFQHIDLEDVKVMRAFMKDMEAVFGKFQSDFVFYRPPMMCALYRIWFDNRSIPRDKFLEAIDYILMQNPTTRMIYQELTRISGAREVSKQIYRKLLFDLNQLKDTTGFKGKFKDIVFKTHL